MSEASAETAEAMPAAAFVAPYDEAGLIGWSTQSLFVRKKQ